MASAFSTSAFSMDRKAQMHPMTIRMNAIIQRVWYSASVLSTTMNPAMVVRMAPPAKGKRFSAAVDVPAMAMGNSSLIWA